MKCIRIVRLNMKHKVQTWATILENRKLMQKSLFYSGFFWIAIFLSIKNILEKLWFMLYIFSWYELFLKICFLSNKWLLILPSYLSKTFHQNVRVTLPKRARKFHQKFFLWFWMITIFPAYCIGHVHCSFKDWILFERSVWAEWGAEGKIHSERGG